MAGNEMQQQDAEQRRQRQQELNDRATRQVKVMMIVVPIAVLAVMVGIVVVSLNIVRKAKENVNTAAVSFPAGPGIGAVVIIGVLDFLHVDGPEFIVHGHYGWIPFRPELIDKLSLFINLFKIFIVIL